MNTIPQTIPNKDQILSAVLNAVAVKLADIPQMRRKSIYAELRRQKPDFKFDTGESIPLRHLFEFKLALNGKRFWDRFEQEYPIVIV